MEGKFIDSKFFQKMMGHSLGYCEITNIPRKWIQYHHKFSNRLLADSVLELYLKQTDPDAAPVINIAPGMSKKEFVDLAYTKHM